MLDLRDLSCVSKKHFPACVLPVSRSKRHKNFIKEGFGAQIWFVYVNSTEIFFYQIMSKDLFNLYHESLIEIKIISQIYYLFSWWSQPHCQFLLTIEYYWGSDICLWTYRGRNNIFLFFSFFNRQALYISILLVVNYRNWNLPNLSQKEKSHVQALCRKSRNGWVLGKTKSKESNKCVWGLSGYSSLLLYVNLILSCCTVWRQSSLWNATL